MCAHNRQLILIQATRIELLHHFRFNLLKVNKWHENVFHVAKKGPCVSLECPFQILLIWYCGQYLGTMGRVYVFEGCIH